MSQTVAILEPGYADYRAERAVLSGHGIEVVAIGKDDDAVTSLKALDPVAVMVRERAVTATEIDSCENLRIIVRYGVGVDNVDTDYAAGRRIYVANVPDYGAEIEVSEHAVALYLAVQRRIVTRDAEVRSGTWGVGQAAHIPSREGAVLGLIGCGRIGLAAAKKFRVLGFDRVLAYDPYLDPKTAAAEALEAAPLDDICSEADVISLHAPLTAETHHILNAGNIARMKPTTIVVNVSRGGLVDEAALAAALAEGRIFGAGVDVFEREPVRQDNPLLHVPGTVLSDHTAWYSERAVGVLQRSAASEIARVIEGSPPRNWVNRW